jgi:1-phosphofructokinase family hexose kinase
VLSGSLPKGIPPKFYYSLITDLKQFAAEIFLDTSGQPLKLALPADPDLIKPNQEELEEICEKELSLTGIINISKELVNQGIKMVLVSRGKEGAVLTTKKGSLQAVPPQVKPASTVGAGDSLVAGMAVGYQNQKSTEEMLKFAVAESIATILTPGAEMGTYKEAKKWEDKVKVKKLN